MSKKYVCLPDYFCRCRPRGKAVSRATILNHRRIANSKLYPGENILPWGPQYYEAGSVLEAFRVRGDIAADGESLEECPTPYFPDAEEFLAEGEGEAPACASWQAGENSSEARVDSDGDSGAFWYRGEAGLKDGSDQTVNSTERACTDGAHFYELSSH